ncbi:MAG TPA: hypothetical protein VNN80_23355 [Polyangiaceae bacterium]|nr:hypothetical protein [Polyangiaceae bacterium]
MNQFHSERPVRRGRHRGPPPGIVASVFTILFLASLIPVTLLVSETHFPTPFQPVEEIVEYFRVEATKVRWCAFLQFGSAIPLGIYTATMVSRLRFLGINVAGVWIAWFGGLTASLCVAFSALIQWALSQPGMGDASVVRALHLLAFATGGPGYTVPVGLLFAGLAIPTGLMRLVPKRLAVVGVALGLCGVLSSASLVVPELLFLVPLTRFPGFVWLIWMGFAVPASRRARAASAPSAVHALEA